MQTARDLSDKELLILKEFADYVESVNNNCENI